MKSNRSITGLGLTALGLCLTLVLAGVLFNAPQAAETADMAMQCPNGPLAADLTGDAISNISPAGMARFREKGNNGLMINVRQVNVAANTSLDVYVGETKVGTIEIGRGRNGQLRLDSSAATIDEGSVITVRNGTTTILTGTFACVAGRGNANSNGNDNGNVNGNMNSNMNMNTNVNMNVNTNVNVNTNLNTNTNTNSNRGSNSNANRGNRNTNRNTNTNTNTNASPSPSPGL